MSLDLTRDRREWAYTLIRLVDAPPPLYGSADWQELDNSDPAKLAAAIVAAEAAAIEADLERKTRTRSRHLKAV